MLKFIIWKNFTIWMKIEKIIHEFMKIIYVS